MIDESHNLRNDKSSRYKFLVENVLLPNCKNRDVKVLQLSATPINNGFIDVRNQFKLMVKGDDDGFREAKDLLAEHYLDSFDKPDFPKIQELYYAGNVDNSIFETDMFYNGYTIDDAKNIDKNAGNYGGFMIFSMQLAVFHFSAC